MKLLVITCWCGGQEYADMTRNMLCDLQRSLEELGCGVRWAVTEQGVPKGTQLKFPLREHEVVTLKRNGGFAVGMNAAFRKGLFEDDRVMYPDAVLCLNNDIRMPDKGWLKVLAEELQDDAIICPTTNYCSVSEQRALKAVDKNPVFHGVTPAICWLIPWSIVAVIMEHLGEGKLFPEDLGGRAWGEDNYTAGLVRAKVRRDPFKIVPRSWIHHLGARTSSKIPAEERMAAHREAHARLKREGLC